MIRTAAFVSLVALMAAPVAAQTFRAENRVKVTPVAGGFSVPNGGGFGASGMWCAAADYARRVRGARGNQRIYVSQPTSAGSRAPVVFTLDPTGLTPSRVTIVGTSVRTAGASLTVNHANIFCSDAKLINR